MSAEEGFPVPPHLASEFYLWIWWTSEKQKGMFDLGDDHGSVELWVDERMTFRPANSDRVRAVLTGEPSASLESRAALVGGKVIQDLRMRIRRDEREFMVTLKGPEMHFHSVKLPQNVDGGGEEALYDRMFLHNELRFIVGRLFSQFCPLRIGREWILKVAPEIECWAAGKS